ncbi:MAG: hypothetical protein ACR2NA_01855 [Solirubrobacterales bacterium]
MALAPACDQTSAPKNDVARVILASDLENVLVITPAWAHPAHGDGRTTLDRSAFRPFG